MSKIFMLWIVVASLFTFAMTEIANEKEMSVQQLELAKKLIEEQLAAYEDPWRWYQIVGIGIAILVGFQCVRCCFPLCLGCGMICCTALFLYIQSFFIKRDQNNEKNNAPQHQFQSKLFYTKVQTQPTSETNYNSPNQSQSFDNDESLNSQEEEDKLEEQKEKQI